MKLKDLTQKQAKLAELKEAYNWLIEFGRFYNSNNSRSSWIPNYEEYRKNFSYNNDINTLIETTISKAIRETREKIIEQIWEMEEMEI